MEDMQIQLLKDRLKAVSGCGPSEMRIVRSPLRVSPLGAHVDHQDGLVTGMVLDRAIYLAFVPRADRQVRVESMNYPGGMAFSLDAIPQPTPSDWGNYARGAAQALMQSHQLRVGMDAVVLGSMPIGGLSSSAAVGIAYLLALEEVNDVKVSPAENIELDRYIENVYLGLKNGVLDQSVILLSSRDCLTYLDCSSMEIAKVPAGAAPTEFEILVVYSGVHQTLVGTDYNRRVTECQQAAHLLLEWSGLSTSNREARLRQVPVEVYLDLGSRLPEPLDRRARHFFTELHRVREGVEAWRVGDIGRLGELMRDSGASSVYNYESGSLHLTSLYGIMCDCPGVYGARFSGGGFRGSCIGLSHPDYREEITAYIAQRYATAHPDIADSYSIHFCQTAEAAHVMNGQAHP
jgi:galactokinase